VNVDGVDIPQHVIDHALLGLDRRAGFTFADVQACLVRAGVDKDPAYRCADRVLQSLRRSGAIFFSNKKWWASEVRS